MARKFTNKSFSTIFVLFVNFWAIEDSSYSQNVLFVNFHAYKNLSLKQNVLFYSRLVVFPRNKCWLWKSIKYKITPFSELNYRESQSTTFDPDLHIPNELFENQKSKNVPLELVTGQGINIFFWYGEVLFMRHFSCERFLCISESSF